MKCVTIVNIVNKVKVMSYSDKSKYKKLQDVSDDKQEFLKSFIQQFIESSKSPEVRLFTTELAIWIFSTGIVCNISDAILSEIFSGNTYLMHLIKAIGRGLIGLLFMCIWLYIHDRNLEKIRGIKTKYPELSVVRVFQDKLEPKIYNSALLTLIATGIYIFLGRLWDVFDINYYFVTLALIYVVLVYLELFLIEFRIKKGFYGGNEFEAREIINYLLYLL